MHEVNHDEGSYRVLLIGIEEDTDEGRGRFCKTLAEKSSIPLPRCNYLLNRCPVVLKYNLSRERAQMLGEMLKGFGAIVSVENRIAIPSISLEFQKLASPLIELETSHLFRTQTQTWRVTGRVRNVGSEKLDDVWVLVQLFEKNGDFLTFEEVPIAINPLPPGESSPFKAILEGDLPIGSVTIGFKHSAGNPIPAVDRRQFRWTDVEIKAEHETVASDEPPLEDGGATEEQLSFLGDSCISHEIPERVERLKPPDEEKMVEPPVPPHSRAPAPASMNEGGNAATSLPFPPPLPFQSGLRANEVEMIGVLFPELNHPPTQVQPAGQETQDTSPAYQEAGQLLEKISASGIEPLEVEQEPRRVEETEHPEDNLPMFPWMEDFIQSIEAYYRDHADPFSIWMDACRKQNGVPNRFHTLLVILAHSRFHQMTKAERALENTQKVFQLLAHQELRLEEIPLLEGTKYFPGDQWGLLFQRALPRIQQVAQNILSQKRWNSSELERLIQVIPHMSARASRRSTRRIHALMSDEIEIDFSKASVLVEKSLYRVITRLGVVDPQFDSCEGPNSIGDRKIQRFASAAFPLDPLKVEEPMIWLGDVAEGEGYCSPTHPRCDGCLFSTFCARRYFNIDPAEKGIRRKD